MFCILQSAQGLVLLSSDMKADNLIWREKSVSRLCSGAGLAKICYVSHVALLTNSKHFYCYF